MSSPKKDFEYPLKDINLLKVAFQTLKEDEKKAANYSFLTGGLIYGSYCYFRVFSRPFRVITVVFGSVIVYNMVSHEARNNYGRLAEICNKNASLSLNLMMQ